MEFNRNKWWPAFLLVGIVLIGILFFSGESAPSALANHTTFVQLASTTAQPTSTAVHSTSTATPTPPTLLTNSQVGGQPIDSVAVVRYRFVNVNRAALDGNSFALPLFDGVTMTTVMDNRQDLRDAIGPGAGDGFLWTGHLMEPGSEQAITGSLVLVIAHSDFIVARVSQPGSSHIYVVHYAGDGINGVHALYDMDLNLVPPDAEPIRNPGLIPPDPESMGTRLTGGAEPPLSKRVGGKIYTPAVSNTIGYIGVATTNAISASGGFSHIQADFETMIAYTNVALANSEIDAALQLEAVGGEAYTESGNIGTDLSRLGNCSDGYMDDVCVWRASYGGDLAQLAILGTSGNVGIATLPGWASVSFWDQLLLSGASHEVGHNMCAGHAREDGGQGCWGDSYGYNSPSGFFGDIMSYRQEGQSLYQGYSNPDVIYCPVTCGAPSFPTGISKPDPNSANNARVMNYMAPTIAAWCGGGSCSN